MNRPPSTPGIFALVVLALVAGAAACGGLQTLRETVAGYALMHAPATPQRYDAAALEPLSALAAPAAEPEPIAPPSNLVRDSARLQAARDALQAMPGLSGKPLTVFRSINVYGDGRINLELVDPDVPSHVDSYHFQHGYWRKGDPVNPQRMAPTYTLRNSSAPLQDIDFTAVARVAQALQEQRNVLMRQPGEVDYVYLIIRKGARLSWRPDEVDGDRETVRLHFDAGGNLLDVATKR
ncbi:MULTISPECIES: hypothetical protein [Stenotrophomonas]|uniref:hypothetical protein n=1 Tax=Stenotrophomonas TaxID=40323 RepID=UPI000D53F3E4|nr:MULTISPECIES: hypothetical protein [Stenotrophomonas]AWH20774.1 hypothetical protein C1933_05810 [Stenotrophomonas sp. ZAC14D2_NAIMI4_6]